MGAERPGEGQCLRYAACHRSLALPRTLWDAAPAPAVLRMPGAGNFVRDGIREHFAASREWEEREYRRHVSDLGAG